MKDKLTDILASCLEAMERGENSMDELLARYPAYRSDLESLLKTVMVVKQRADFAPRPNFRLSSRARLLRLLESQAQPHNAERRSKRPLVFPKFSRKLAASWAILLALVVSMIGGGTAYASNGALPGDALHPVKLFVEEARLFAAGDAEKAALAIQFVDIRMQEIQTLAAANATNRLSLAVSLLNEKIAAANAAIGALAKNNPERAAQLALQFEDALLRHAETLTLQMASVPDEAKPALERAIQASSAGQQTVENLFEIGLPPETPKDTPPPLTTEPAGAPPEHIPASSSTPPAGGPPGTPPAPIAPPPGGGPPEHIPAPVKPPPGGGPPTSRPGNKP